MTDTTTKEIAEHLTSYLESNLGVCADLNAVHGWLRARDGEWQIVRYAGSRPNDCVKARTVDREQAVNLLEDSPSSLEPVAEAGVYNSEGLSVWDHAEDQDAFSDRERCYWCGHSDRSREIRRYETVDDGECPLCEECHDYWEASGEIVATVQEAGSA